MFIKKIEAPGVRIATSDAVLHLNSTGPKTAVSILIEAGAACSSPHYSYLQKALAKQLQVYSYDRAGNGWSDTSKNPRDSESIAVELSQLLDAASIKGPLVFVGHSAACFHLKVFAHRYPERVAAIVLLDPSNPVQEQVLGLRVHTPALKRNYRKMQWVAQLGLAGFYSPLFTLSSPKISPLSDSAKQQLAWIYKQAKTYVTSEAEYAQFANSAKQALAVPCFGDLPLKVITGPDRTHDGDLNLPIQRKRWMDLQADIASWSTHGDHIVIEEAGHMTLFTEKKNAQRVAVEIINFCREYGFDT
ncbi:alpha/beta hydrolase [Porticoccaceae bacterium]|nr:alpha/beta hydrolase [Porticoccaceae bacterium]